jgi:hypothetical protein
VNEDALKLFVNILQFGKGGRALKRTLRDTCHINLERGGPASQIIKHNYKMSVTPISKISGQVKQMLKDTALNMALSGAESPVSALSQPVIRLLPAMILEHGRHQDVDIDAAAMIESSTPTRHSSCRQPISGQETSQGLENHYC